MIHRFVTSRAYLWTPVVLAGTLAIGAAPLTAGHRPPEAPGQTFGVTALTGDSPYAPPGWRTSLALYWLVAGVGAYVLSAVVVARGDRQLGRPFRPRAWTAVLLVLLGGFWAVSQSVARLLHVPAFPVAQIGDSVSRGNQALLCVSAGLVILGVARRRWGLLAFPAMFAAVALLANLYDIENQFPSGLFSDSSSIWESSEEVNVVVAGLVLMLAGGAGMVWSFWRGGLQHLDVAGS